MNEIRSKFLVLVPFLSLIIITYPVGFKINSSVTQEYIFLAIIWRFKKEINLKGMWDRGPIPFYAPCS